MKIRKIISGGQTGADRAAFDFALDNSIAFGGYVPKGRLAEDGRISEKYQNLIETESKNYAERTELNVMNSDATILITRGNLVGGSLITKKLAEKHLKPLYVVNFESINPASAGENTATWLQSIECEILNIAGSRASKDPQIYSSVKEFLSILFDRDIF